MKFGTKNQLFVSFGEKLSKIPAPHLLGLIVACAIFLGFGLHHLGQFMTVDEEKWLYVRVRQLYTAIANADWANTYINDKPGVLPSLLSGIVFFFTDVSRYTSQTIEKFLFFWRLPIVLFNLAMVLFTYKFLRDLLDRRFALILTAAVATNPTLIGLSQIVNPDATLWSTSLVASIVFLLFVKTGRLRYVFITSAFLSAALISKFAATYFFIAFYIILVFGYLIGVLNRDRFRTLSLGWIGIILLASFGYFILFPATWQNFDIFWQGTLGCDIIHPVLKPLAGLVVLFTLEASVFREALVRFLQVKGVGFKTLVGLLGTALLVLMTYVIVRSFSDEDFFGSLQKGFRGGKPFLDSLFANTFVFLNTVNTVTVAGFFVFAGIGIAVRFSRSTYAREPSFPYVIFFGLLGFAYVLGTSLAGFYASSRYQMFTFPFYAMAAGGALLFVIRRQVAVFSLIVLVSLAEIVEVSPFYFCYANRLNVHDEVLTEAWGLGGYEAAKWISRRFDEEDAAVWYDREGFSQFSDNQTYRWTKRPWTIQGLNYLVLTARGRKWAHSARKRIDDSRWTYGPLLEYYDGPYVFNLSVGGNPNNFIRVVEYTHSEIDHVHLATALRSNGGLGYLDMSKPQSISFWINSRKLTPGAPFLVDGSFASALSVESRSDMAKGGLRFRMASKGEDSVLETGYIHDGKWHHIVWYQRGGKEGDIWGLFVDGEAKGSAELPSRKSGIHNIRAKKFRGKMEGFRTFKHALTPAEVVELYTSESGDKEEDDDEGEEPIDTPEEDL